MNKRVNVNVYPFFILVFTLLISFQTTAQNDFDKKSEEAYNLVLQFELDKSDLLTDSSSTPSLLYVRHLSKAIRAIINENDSVIDDFENFHDYSYDIIDKKSKESPYTGFYLAEMKLQSAIINIKYNEEWSALINLRKAYYLIHDNVELYPDFLPNYKTLGILHVLIGSIPSKYQWALSIFGFEGKVDQGLNDLDKLIINNSIFSTETMAISAFIQSFILQNSDKAVSLFEKIIAITPENPLFNYLYASLLVKNSKSELALNVINESLVPSDQNNIQVIPMVNYLKAEIFMQKGNYSSAISWYKHFVKYQQGTTFIKDSYYKIALCYLMSGNETKANEFVEYAKVNGSTFTEADKYAERQIDENEFPNVSILRLRYATDGGYYENAEQLITQMANFNFASKLDEVEFNYRSARFYHKTNSIPMAIALYKVTINASENEDWYFAPNSALQLGYIYRDLEDLEMARKYFTLALTYKEHEYKNSIDNKAKTALERMSR